ncbi:MAG: hypothetical protein QF632_00460 [Candidatus Woesearchaeota archaeon]|nr:hypothetical protein [Candidatus Woesearchaeota archaeon]
MAAMQSGELPSAGGAESAGPADSAAVGILKAEVINPNEQLE